MRQHRRGPGSGGDELFEAELTAAEARALAAHLEGHAYNIDPRREERPDPDERARRLIRAGYEAGRSDGERAALAAELRQEPPRNS